MEKYETPIMDVVRFEQEDIITLSNGGTGAGDEGEFGDLFGD
mgnify:CR=1 FL=1